MSKDVDLDDVIDGRNQGQGEPGDGGEDFDERGGFDGGRRRQHPGVKGFMMLLFLICLGIVAFIFWQNTGGSDEPQDTRNEPEPGSTAVGNYRFPTNPPDNEPAEPAEPEPAPDPEPDPVIPPLPTRDTGRLAGGGPGAEQPPSPEELAMQRRLSNFGEPTQASVDSIGQAANQASQVAQASQASNDFFQRLNSGNVGRARASHLENPSMTVPQGTVIPCGTVTQLDTTQPGMVGCTVSRDVYSADRRVRLIDKGANVTGFVGTGIEHGQARVFVAWNRMRNPDNVVINLDSPGVGRLGAAGVTGQVDSHFWDRFGGAMLVSVIGDMGDAAVELLGDEVSDGNTNINLNNTSSTTNTLAQEALKASIDIPPTLFANHGKPVAIYVAQDLDFSDVYGLELK